MAVKNKTIINSKTGQGYTFLQTTADTKGRLLEMESSFAPHSTEPPLHYHPDQFEDFTILEGTLTVKINGSLRTLKKGDELHVPANTAHAMWNNDDVRATVNWKVQPALNTEHLLETFTGLANDGKTNAFGMPAFLQATITANKFSNTFRLVKPPFVMQKILFILLTPISLLFGYRSIYKKYLD